MFARFGEILTIKESKLYGRTDGQTDRQHENSIPKLQVYKEMLPTDTQTESRWS